MLAEFDMLRSLWQSMSESGENRFNFYLMFAFGGSIAIGLINNLPDKSLIPYLTILILLGVLFIGFVTFLRVVERTIAMTVYVRGMNRIRRYFTDNDPDLLQYLILPVSDDVPRFSRLSLRTKGVESVGLCQIIALTNSLISGISFVILARNLLTRNILFDIIAGVLIAILAYYIQVRFQSRKVSMRESMLEIRFPTA